MFRNYLNQTITVGLFLIVLLSPTQYAFSLKGANVSPVDPLIWLIGLMWFISVVTDPERFSAIFSLFPPFENILAVFLIVLSLFKTFDWGALKEIIQLTEYLIVAFLLFSRVSRSDKQQQNLVTVFSITISCIVLVGLIHYFDSSRSVMDVKATFGNRNVYSGFLAVALPFILVRFLYTDKWLKRLWYGVTLIGGIITILSGASALAFLTAAALVCALKSSRTLIVWTLFVVIMVAVVFPRLPRKNLDVLYSSISLYDESINVNPRYTEWQASLQMWGKDPLFGTGVGSYQSHIGQHYGFLPIPEGEKEPDHNNLFLVLGSSTGIIGLAGFIIMILIWYRKLLIKFLKEQSETVKIPAIAAIGTLTAFCINSIWTSLLVRGVFMTFIFIIATAFLKSQDSKAETPS